MTSYLVSPVVRTNWTGLFVAIGMIFASGCSMVSGQRYQDNYPEPCSVEWFAAVEDHIRLADTHAKMPSPGSPEWLEAADKKLSIYENTGYPVGDIEWCHALHQKLIGL